MAHYKIFVLAHLFLMKPWDGSMTAFYLTDDETEA